MTTTGVHRAVVESAADKNLRTRFESDVIPKLEPLYRHAMRLTRNHADAEDLLQDTMMKAYSAFRSFKQDTNVQGWLSRIMTNTYINGYRKQRRRPVHYLPGNFTEELQSTALHPSTAGTQSAEQQALDKLGDTVIAEAMRALPDQFRLAVYYADIEGFSTKEIADLMQTPVGTVTSRVYRGRRLLRHILADVANQRRNTTVDDAA
jgi:RNA polymerase sigma-70 factor (ECF subfamily)